MKEFWNAIQFAFTVLGGWIGYFLGGCDGLIIALASFVAVDYFTGLMCAINDKRLSSKHHRYSGYPHRQCTQDGSFVFLPLKRGYIAFGKRSTSRTPYSEKAERSSGTAAS